MASPLPLLPLRSQRRAHIMACWRRRLVGSAAKSVRFRSNRRTTSTLSDANETMKRPRSRAMLGKCAKIGYELFAMKQRKKNGKCFQLHFFATSTDCLPGCRSGARECDIANANRGASRRSRNSAASDLRSIDPIECQQHQQRRSHFLKNIYMCDTVN